MENANKSERLNLRIEPGLRRLFQTAADLENKNLSAFVLEAARVRAEQRLADQDRFALPPDRFAAFMEALERPPRNIPRLRQLLTEEPAIGERRTHVRRTEPTDAADPPDEL